MGVLHRRSISSDSIVQQLLVTGFMLLLLIPGLFLFSNGCAEGGKSAPEDAGCQAC